MDLDTFKTPVIPTISRVNILKTINKKPLISVVVSLYNYRQFIINTLDSIAGQTFDEIELVVVDDRSTDDSDDLVEAWLKENSNRFFGASLLQHEFHAGLACVRNTGFSYASAEWVSVQDADNPLAPNAFRMSYLLAKKVDNYVAVIHPLLLRVPVGISSSVFQGEGRPWQKVIFEPSNAVDAMALVRRRAWEDVGGYVHIPGGWEDYDFWCSLIEKGWTGVQCPHVLGSYTCHPTSMTKSTSLPNARRLEKFMLARHPWLNCFARTSESIER